MTEWTLPLGLPLLDESFPLPLDKPFTRAHAKEAGLSAHQIRTLEKRGFIRRMIRGVYVVAQSADSRPLRAAALSLVVPHTGVVTDWTACWLWTGIDAPGDHLRAPTLSVFHRHPHTRLNNGLSEGGARTFKPSDLMRVGGINVTTPLRTAWDLGRLVHRDRAIGGMDALLRLGRFHPRGARRRCRAVQGHARRHPAAHVGTDRRRTIGVAGRVDSSACAGWRSRACPSRRHRCPSWSAV